MTDLGRRRLVRRLAAALPEASALSLARATAARLAARRGLRISALEDDAVGANARALPALDDDAFGADLLCDVFEARLATAQRKRTGAHYTPRAIADWLVARAPTEGVLLDPACGAGRFLLAAVRARGGDPGSDAVAAIRGCELDPDAAEVAALALSLESHGGDAERAHRHWRERIAVGDALAAELPRCAAFVGNPPYFSALGQEALQAFARARFAAVYSGRNDVSHFFVALGLERLEEGGGLALVLPSYVLENTFAAKLRAALDAALGEETLVDLGDARLFDAQVHALLLVGRKGGVRRRARFGVRAGIQREALLSALARGTESEVLAPREDEPAFIEAMAKQAPLSAFAEIEKGPETGLNEAFVMSRADARARGIEPAALRPLVKGRHVGAFRLAKSDEVMIFFDGRAAFFDDRAEPERFPRAVDHLRAFEAALRARADCRDGRYPWWRLHRPRSAALADAKVKLVAPYRTMTPVFAVDREGALNDGGDVRFLLPRPGVDADYLCGVLNSAAVRGWLAWRGKKKGPLFELFQEPLSRIPIPDARTPDAARIAALARELADEPDPREKRAALDEMVWRAYGVEPAPR